MANKFLIPSLAIYDPTFTQLTQAGCVILRTDDWAQLLVQTNALLGSSNLIYGYDSIGDSIYRVSVDNRGYLNVNAVLDTTQGVQRGLCTDANGTGFLDQNDDNYHILDSISLSQGDTIEVSGFFASSNIDANVELVTKIDTTYHYELVGIINGSPPHLNPVFGVPIEILGDVAKDLILRIKRLDACDNITASGRIFARKV